MGQHYKHIGADERNFIQRHANLGHSQGWIASALGRPRSAISREIRRNLGGLLSYDAATAAASALGRRGPVKLA